MRSKAGTLFRQDFHSVSFTRPVSGIQSILLPGFNRSGFPLPGRGEPGGKCGTKYVSFDWCLIRCPWLARVFSRSRLYFPDYHDASFTLLDGELEGMNSFGFAAKRLYSFSS